MGKRKFTKKLSSLPKGLPTPKSKRARASIAESANINPFESARASSAKAPKFHVHNRPISGRINPNNAIKGAGSALKRALDNRKAGLRQSMQKNKKAGAFIDRRIGESRKAEMTEEERMLARIVRERASRSKKRDKYALGEDVGNDTSLSMTHKGQAIDESYTGKNDAYAILSDEEDDKYGGQLERADTEMHFGGGEFDEEMVRLANSNPYGPSGGAKETLGDRYRTRKEELDDLIMRKKYEKAEKAKAKEEQVETFEEFDENFKELASLLKFRDKEKDRRTVTQARKDGTQSQTDKEMDEWDTEMKSFMFERRVKATDRTKTTEEIAKGEAERLHELETRRLARMSGDFEDDDFSDISDDEEDIKSKKKRGKKTKEKTAKRRDRNPDELDSEDEEDDELEAKFTADGLVYVDKEGNIVKKAGEEKSDEEEENPQDSSDEDSDNLGASDDDASFDSGDGLSSGEESDMDEDTILEVGTQVKGKYLADQQMDGKSKWYRGQIKSVKTDEAGNTLYDILYDDGDVEEGAKPENVRRRKESANEKKVEEEMKQKLAEISSKRRKAKQKARTEIPYIFEVPKTLDSLHDMIGTYATTGPDASLIIQRIHAANSVKLDHRNTEKMQNFYDVLLKRFIGVGDALCKGGNGGEDLGRYDQLDSLVQVLYSMTQDSPQSAAAVWKRRLGIMQNALSKRLRDAEFVSIDDEEDFSAWASTGILLAFRAIGHIFPVTDMRHVVVTPALILMGQTLGQTPIRSAEDVMRGVFLATLMIEYTKGAKRISPEAFSFLAGVLNLFADNMEEACQKSPIPSFIGASKVGELQACRESVIKYFKSGRAKNATFQLSLEKEKMTSLGAPAAILISTLRLIRMLSKFYARSLNQSESEAFHDITCALLRLSQYSSKAMKLPGVVSREIKSTVEILREELQIGDARRPLTRRASVKASELAIKTLAPRMEDPDKYFMGKDKDKTRAQAQRDRMRREYKREHKAVSRELRLDAAFIESERRKDKDKKDNKARNARNKNYAWLENEQATMNQQVAQGGGLLSGGGIGAARAKAKSGRIGMKRGGKF
mmetsp:Transcript_24863/g.36768  ORF Transcript_24863/g.36768 Transcript_24863/m.36768 type:complete len:1065 (+) Transcript_24863:87-3281(+)